MCRKREEEREEEEGPECAKEPTERVHVLLKVGAGGEPAPRCFITNCVNFFMFCLRGTLGLESLPIQMNAFVCLWHVLCVPQRTANQNARFEVVAHAFVACYGSSNLPPLQMILLPATQRLPVPDVSSTAL